MPSTWGRGTGESGTINRIPGEPCALKGARTVRREVVKRLSKGNVPSYLLYLIGRWFESSWAHLENSIIK